MKINNRTLIMFSLLALTSYAVHADTLTGDYDCQRTDPANVTNSYPLSVSKTGDTYTFQWTQDGKPVLYGTGVMHPKVNNAVSVIFWDPKNTDVYGVEIFTSSADGSLSADWVLQSGTQVGSETCKKKS